MTVISTQLEIETHGDVTCAKGTVTYEGISLNVYAFVVDGMLVDTGSASLLREFIPFLETAAFDMVALTHFHEDHTGGAAWIQQHRKVPLHIHPMSIDVCAKAGDYPKYRQWFWGERQGFDAKPLGTTLESAHTSWRVIPTPGHSDDHVAFLNPDTGVLFSGDLFVTPKPKTMMRQESIAITMASIRKLLAEDFTEMFCCHAGYLPDGKGLLSMKLEYLENLKGEVLHAHRQGKSISEIALTLFPKMHPLTPLSGREWDAEHIVRNVIEEFGA